MWWALRTNKQKYQYQWRIGAWTSLKRLGELSIFRYCNGRHKPPNANGRWRVHSTRRGWTIFTPASEKKSGEISVSSTGLFCFAYTEGLFSFSVLHSVCLSPAFASQSTCRPRLSLLTRSPVTWTFSLGINDRRSSDSYNRTRSASRESKARGRFTRSEELEETHKHPSNAVKL